MSDDNQSSVTDQNASPANSSQENTVPDEWQSLDGKSQDRFKKLIREKNEAIRKAQEAEERLRSTYQIPTPPVPTQTTQSQTSLDQEAQAAADRLRQAGIADRKDLEKLKSEIFEDFEARKAREMIDSKHERLENKYSSDGYPAYDRMEIEKYMQDSQIYDPEAAYRNLYFDEVVSAESNKKNKGKKEDNTLKTRSRISGSEPWTIEKYREKMAEPGWYQKNQELAENIYNDFAKRGLVI